MDLDLRPLAAVLVSLLAAVLLPLVDRRPTVRETITITAAVLKLALVSSMLPAVLTGQGVEGGSLALGMGLSLQFRVDALGLIFALTASSLWLLTSIYSIGYLRATASTHRTSYYSAFAVCLSATVGIAFSANLLTFFVCYEVLTLATYPLVVHDRTPEAQAAGRRYLVYTLAAGQALLVATVWAETLVPGSEFRPGGFLDSQTPSLTVWVLFVLFIVGCGVKAAIMPLHGWLPAAMVAPTPVSALLHAVAVVKAGVFGIVRIVGYVFGIDTLRATGADTVLIIFAVATMLIASIRALGEDRLKRRLAYSTIGQLSYIVLGAAVGSVAALTGAMFHIAGHGFMKITMFFCAGTVHTQAHRDGVKGLDGLGRQMPVTMTAFAIGACGLAGVPLLAGFIAKWNLGVGAVEVDQLLLVGVLVVSGLLNVAYFFPILFDAFFKASTSDVREAGWAMILPLGVTAAVALLLGVIPDLGLHFFTLARLAAESVVTGAGVPQ